MAKTIRYQKTNGRVPENLLTNIEEMVNESTDGEHVISIGKPKRSIDQNSLMWMWFRCLSEDTKSDPVEFYQYYCELFLKERCKYKDGKFDSGGTSTLKSNEFTEFLNKIQADAASEFRNILPIPEDISWEEFYNQFK